MASAMVGIENDPPIWACNDWRPILGTSVDVRVLPEPLTAREEQLLQPVGAHSIEESAYYRDFAPLLLSIFSQVLRVITQNNPSLQNYYPIPFLLSLSPFPHPFLLVTLTLLLLLFLPHPRLLPFKNSLTSRFPPSLNLLAKPFMPLRSSVTLEPSKRAPHPLPRSLSFIALQQMIREDAFTLSQLEPPSFLDITAPFYLVAPMLNLISPALTTSFFNDFAFLS